MRYITGNTKLLGVIGHPIAHSLSPLMHNSAIEHLGLDYVYLPFPVAPEHLKTALDGFSAIGVVGLSVTIPHKQAVIPHLVHTSALAQAVGAVNTLRWTAEGWEGTNTDVAGFIAPLAAMDKDWSEVDAVILGNGGAARAVVAGCHQLGCRSIHLVGRNEANLTAFKNSWQQVKLNINGESTPQLVEFTVHLGDELSTLISRANLLINTTPIGMHPHGDDSPINVKTIANLPPHAIAYDLIYTPRSTKFLQLAAERGATTIDGLEMLVRQGAVAFEWWLNKPAPVEIMREALMKKLF
jgi:shikimate dehydrogenase